MIAISIACGLVICLFQFDVGDATGQDWSHHWIPPVERE